MTRSNQRFSAIGSIEAFYERVLGRLARLDEDQFNAAPGCTLPECDIDMPGARHSVLGR